jgi:uncharacterized membrane protein YccC
MIPSSLQTSLKVAISGSLAYAIAKFFGFSFTFISSFIAGIFSMAGPGIAWFAFPQLTLIFGLTSILAVIEAYLLGNNYISIFINILFAGTLWFYLQLHGLVFSFFVIAIKVPAIIIMSSSSDKINMGYDMVSSLLIGEIVGLIVGSLFWPTFMKDKLEGQLEQILHNSCTLIEQTFRGYLEGNFDEAEPQDLQLKILKTVRASQKLFKLSSFDITGRQLGKEDWKSILKTEENIALHLSAIVRLAQTSKGVDLSAKLTTDLSNLCQSLTICLSELKTVMIEQNTILDIDLLNRNFIQLQETLAEERGAEKLKAIPISELLRFYSMVHRLGKLMDEVSVWGEFSSDKLVAHKLLTEQAISNR